LDQNGEPSAQAERVRYFDESASRMVGKQIRIELYFTQPAHAGGSPMQQ
jgi:hypothetical protein